jgi:hypothetical protein
MHPPSAQVSPSVHTLPSSQGLVLFVCRQVPSAQASSVQTLPSLQFSGVPAQRPPRHMSPVEQALPSSHAVPLSFAGLEQAPEVGSQTPASWH